MAACEPEHEARPARGPRLALQATLPGELAQIAGIDLADARRIVSLVHRTGALPARSPATIRRSALEAARVAGEVPSIAIAAREASARDPFVKYAFRLGDGAVVEAVRIPLERAGRFSVCVSSQVGCALACAFCATGRLGLGRNLEAWEIVEQVRAVRAELAPRRDPHSRSLEPRRDPHSRSLEPRRDPHSRSLEPRRDPHSRSLEPRRDPHSRSLEPRRDPHSRSLEGRVHGVLFQGMGEPLANADRVIRAIRVLAEPSAQAIDMRNITVCTAGLPAGILRLAREVPAVRLGVSIASVRPGRRRSLMPVDAAHPLEEVLAAAGQHARATRQAPMFAYTLLDGVNDSDDDASALADVAARFAADHGVRPRLSLIPFNAIPPADASSSDRESGSRLGSSPGADRVGGGSSPLLGDDFRRSADDRLAAFRAILIARGVGAIVRYSGGGDVAAACGQLAAASL